MAKLHRIGACFPEKASTMSVAKIAAVAVSVIFALASCSSDGPDSAKNETSSIAVPDAYTSVTVGSIGAPTFPFPATDGKYHVAYDLELTNASAVPATVGKLDVVDASDPSKVIASFSGNAIFDPTCSYGDCNRLRALPSAPAGSTIIPPQETRIFFVDYAFDNLEDAPENVLHHLYAFGAASPAAREATPIDYVTTPVDISLEKPRVIGSPLRGDNWIALNGCCLPGFPHRSSTLPLDGKINNSQRFAIDWKRTNEQGQFYTGDKTKNESYVDYGSAVYAVADGTVVSTLDNVAANAPGVLPAADPVLAAKLTVENVDGNHVILDIGDGDYAMYAHFIEGTVLVEPGDKVKKGDKIAELGNTGNANASHLHFQLMDGPSLLGANGLPYVIDDFDYAGQVDPKEILAADNYLTGSFLQGRMSDPEPRKDELPANLAIIDFPGE
ncbi:M23 family metallopeptidase [Antrihabitans sp. YC2-6]|uniref:M23 family metallopeptidase n=1 Tax=Antrihabitans sp. YC2-6 TaxID=2799498 RepID=UPI0018F4C7C9|nr:M23 family metallopeptidase [Antrihabitans sp. YC2-6]MBJ8345449.1 M23 family metallopeptidase [Antrihabitans sp. YC2-6]